MRRQVFSSVCCALLVQRRAGGFAPAIEMRKVSCLSSCRRSRELVTQHRYAEGRGKPCSACDVACTACATVGSISRVHIGLALVARAS